MLLPKIAVDPDIMMGKPVIASTRITVELILDKFAAGEPAEQIRRAHPHLPENSIEAALGYAVVNKKHAIEVPV